MAKKKDDEEKHRSKKAPSSLGGIIGSAISGATRKANRDARRAESDAIEKIVERFSVNKRSGPQNTTAAERQAHKISKGMARRAEERRRKEEDEEHKKDLDKKLKGIRKLMVSK